MSSDYIFECAETFEELYSKTNEKLELIKTQRGKEEELNKIKNLLSQMENTLNTIELESSLISNKQNGSNEFNITQTCRQHFNEIRKKFNKVENEYFDSVESTGLREVKVDGGFKFSNGLNNLEHLQSRYGGNFPLDNDMIPEELKRLRRREELKKKGMIACGVLIALIILLRLFR